MCGGGGGDGGAAQREQKRQARQDDAVKGLNRQFGMYTKTNEPNRADYTSRRGNYGSMRGQKIFDQTGYDAAMSDWQTQNEQYQTEADANKVAREEQYGNTSQYVKDYYTLDLTDQRDVADRQSKFSLARRGVVGGSSDLDTQSTILGDYNKAVLNIGNRADGAVTDLRQADETARLNAINRIYAGQSADGVVQSSLQQLQNNINDTKANSTAAALGQVFAQYGGYLNNQAAQRGQNSAYQNYSNGYRNHNPVPYSGRVS